MLDPSDYEPEIGALSWYLDAFYELGTCRSIGMSVGPIPFTAIVQYSTIWGIEGEDFEEFSYLMRRLDNKYLELEYKKIGGNTNVSSSPNKNHRNQGPR